MSELLVVKDFGGVPEVMPSAFELRDDALKLASRIRNVTSEDEQSAAVKALRALKSIRTGMEQTRKAVKSPVLDLGKRIDAIAKRVVNIGLCHAGALENFQSLTPEDLVLHPINFGKCALA
jgi:hypothetical protein